MRINEELASPIIVGGLGGSGTRVIAQILERLGYFMGGDLNYAHDNMQLLQRFPIMRKATQGVGPVTTQARPSTIVLEQLGEFADAMKNSYSELKAPRAGWGFKVPGTHLYLASLAEVFPRALYVHVVRHGIDMVFSSNQSQVQNWGHHYGIDLGSLVPEKASLAFWIAANRHAVAESRRLGLRFHLLNFDKLCLQPDETIAEFLEFLRRPQEEARSLLPLIRIPESLGRRAGRDLSFVGERDWAALCDFGFGRDSQLIAPELADGDNLA
jgi:hypothetical protein